MDVFQHLADIVFRLVVLIFVGRSAVQTCKDSDSYNTAVLLMFLGLGALVVMFAFWIAEVSHG